MQMRLTTVTPTPVPRLSLTCLSDSPEPHSGKKGDSRLRTERSKAIGFIPQLASLETSGYIPHIRESGIHEKRHTLPFRSSLIKDINFQLNTQLAAGCFWKKPPERLHAADSPDSLLEHEDKVNPQSLSSEAGDSLSASLSALVDQIQSFQVKRDRLLREKAAEATRLAEEEKKVAEAQKRQTEDLKKHKLREREKQIREAEAIPRDIRVSLIVCRAVERLEETEGYQSFLKSQLDDIKRLRVQLLKVTSAVPNQLAATCSRLMDTYSSISEIRRSLIQSRTVVAALGPSFDGVVEATAKVDSTILAPLMSLTLPTFHLYLKLSQIVIESCQQQVSLQPSTVWMYAHFLGMLFNGWSKDFQLVFYGCLYRESPWLIPLPVSDATKRREASSDELGIWCKKISALFRLRLAICQSQKAAGECWRLVSRLLNRISGRLTHPLSVFLLEAVFDVASCQLSELNVPQFLKVANVCQDKHLAELKKMCLETDVWPEWKVPIIKIDERLSKIVAARGIVREKPEGYQMMQQASELDADI